MAVTGPDRELGLYDLGAHGAGGDDRLGIENCFKGNKTACYGHPCSKGNYALACADYHIGDMHP